MVSFVKKCLNRRPACRQSDTSNRLVGSRRRSKSNKCAQFAANNILLHAGPPWLVGNPGQCSRRGFRGVHDFAPGKFVRGRKNDPSRQYRWERHQLQSTKAPPRLRSTISSLARQEVRKASSNASNPSTELFRRQALARAHQNAGPANPSHVSP